MTNVLTTIIQALTDFVTGSATAIGDGLETLLFVTGTDGAISGLTSAGSVIFTLVGIGMAVGIMGVVFNLIRTRG